jgi:ferritin-like metal-binding protein YciE
MSERYDKKPAIKLADKSLRSFFIIHLNRIYAAKAHLVEKLPLLIKEVSFKDLELAIRETVDDVSKQMARMELIYALMDAKIHDGSINGLKGLVDDSFNAINEVKGKQEICEMSIIFYLQIIESMEMASFQMLQMTAVKLKNKQVKQLLKENYDEAKADRTLMLLIAAKYLTN